VSKVVLGPCMRSPWVAQCPTGFSFASLLCPVLLSACSGAGLATADVDPIVKAWTRTTTVVPSDDFVRSVATSPDGGYALGGYTRQLNAQPSSNQPGQAAQWGALVHLVQQGEPQSLVLGPSGGSDYVQSVTFDNDFSLYVAGYTTGALGSPRGGHDAFLARYRPSGELVWVQQWGSDLDDDVYALTVTREAVVIGGYTEGVLEGNTAAGGTDAFLSWVSKDGAVRSAVQFGSSGNDYLQDLTSTPDGTLYLTGYTDGAFDDAAVFGGNDVFVAEYTPDGAHAALWQWGTPQTDYGLGIAAAEDYTVVVGYTYGTLDGQAAAGKEDAFAVAFDAGGSVIWNQQWGGPNNDNARSVALDARGVAWVVGDTQWDSPSHRVPFLRAFDSTGRLVVEETWTSSASDFALDISLGTAVANSNAAFVPFVLAGYTQSTTPSATPERDVWAITGQVSYGQE
jgi:hypothetical protein